MAPGTLPDFFVIGVPKAGTTALHVALARHPALFLSRLKEPKHFLCDGCPPAPGGGRHAGGPGDAKSLREWVWRREDYEALFADAPLGSLGGESSPFYLYDPAAQLRLAAAVPRARLIAVLRDPVDRAHSNWTHLWSAGLEPEGDFVRACRLGERRRAAGWAPFWQYLDLGLYGGQLQRLLTRFPREQVLLLRYRDLRDEPVATLDRICGFLGVPSGVLQEVPAENVTTHASPSLRNRTLSAGLRAGARLDRGVPGACWRPVEGWLSRRLQREQRPRQPLTADQRAVLLPYFAADVALLEQLTGESYAGWLAADRPAPVRLPAARGRIGTAYGSIDRPLDPVGAASGGR